MKKLVLAFYPADQESGREILKILRLQKLYRVSALCRTQDGSLKIYRRAPSPWPWTLLSTFSVLLLSLASHLPADILAALSVAAFLIVVTVLWWLSGPSKGTCLRYSPYVLENEILIIFQHEKRDLSQIFEILRTVGEGHPAIFVVHDTKDVSQFMRDMPRREPLAADSLSQYAKDLAVAHRISKEVHPRQELLKRLDECKLAFDAVRRDLSEAVELEQRITPSAEWLLDNAYIIQGHITDIRKNLPRRYAKDLPVLVESPHPRFLRIQVLAEELVRCTDARLIPSNIVEFLVAYQTIAPLTIGELWAFPVFLRFVLVEELKDRAVQVDRRQYDRERADLWANRLLNAARRDPNQLLSILAQLTAEVPAVAPHFAVRLIGHLYDEEAALVPVQRWLEHKRNSSLQEIIRQEQARQAAYQVSIANAIGSLRQLANMDWRDTFESVSVVESVLRTDPSGDYSRSDFATRDSCRKVVEKLARTSANSEGEVARQAIEVASKAYEDETDLRRHVLYHLLAEGRESQEQALRCKVPVPTRFRRWIEKRAGLIFLGGIALLSISFVAAALFLSSHGSGFPAWLLLSVACLAVFPASELGVQIIQTLVSWIFRPRVLPKLYFRNGIPEEYRTLVAVPMMLLTRDSVQEEVEKLEIRYLSNRDAHLCFALLSDFTDAPSMQMPEDLDLLEVAVRGLENLNLKYRETKFFLFHRARRFCKTQQCWMGWERKRGKIEDLNAYLNGEENSQELLVGDRQSLGRIGFVITLDADTQLPHGAARRLVETIAHPLNSPRLAPDQGHVLHGYAIIQPRVSITLPSATATPFTRLFSDPSGADPYASAVSDVYQDLFGEGIFHGKAIFDSRVFHQLLGGRFPEDTLLSHDLIEGAHVRAGYASDIELFEQFPVNYQSYIKRQHRWIRGDWQIASWILRSVTGPRGARVPNALSLINRWKIFDNLRRSLVPAASVLLLITNWFLLPEAWIWSLLVALMLLAPGLLTLPLRTIESLRGVKDGWRATSQELLRALMVTALLPHQAVVAMDAIGRVAYRRFFSHRHLLEWESAQVAHWQAASGSVRFILHMFILSLGTSLLAIVLRHNHFDQWAAAAPFLLLWLLSPMVAEWMNGHKRQLLEPRLSPEDRRFLRQIACQTWRYFDDFVGPQTNWLPPDNSQESLRIELAQRTSPTNIGLWLLSAVAAYDFGILTRDQMIERTSATLATLQGLERYEGHWLNWYDIHKLQPLRPPYVSTVDSGNLLAAFWVLEQGYSESLDLPLIGPAALRAISDRLDLLRAILERQDLKSGTVREGLVTLARILKSPPDDLEELVRRIRQAVDPARRLAHSLRASLPAGDDRVYWAGRIEAAVLEWAEVIDRYLLWFELLVADLESSKAEAWLDKNLKVAPTLKLLAEGEFNLSSLSEAGLPLRVGGVMSDKAGQELFRAQSRAREAVNKTEECLTRLRSLGSEINFRFLYDGNRRLFAIGYNVGSQSRDSSYYDLLASEARLASQIAIARGEIPAEHWLTLGRPYGMADGRPVLLSWNGTMFEYLMPVLFTRNFENSLLDYACRAAVAHQKKYATQRGMPWGISEAAFSALDANRIYQYRAFGVPGLGLKRGLEEDLVVSPYSSFLALAVDPPAALRNLKRLARLGMRGSRGFFEAIDYTRQHQREGDRGVIIYAYMAHHQGMSLLAVDNMLNDKVMQKRFHADPRVRSTEPLFFERIPASSTEYFNPAPERPIPRSIEALPSAGRVNTEHTAIPRAHLLSNGSYSLMVTNSGGGYARWRDYDLTRWRADTTRDACGSFCYVRGMRSGAVWSTSFHPLDRPERRYSATLTSDKAQFCRRDAGIETLVEIVISPEDDAEIRRIRFTNGTPRTRHLEITSYMELALAPHSSDRAHPAFSRMFVQTEALPVQKAILAWRRARSPDDPGIFAGHIIAASAPLDGAWEFETDRVAFVGRGRNLRNPRALDGRLSAKSGTVLDPIFSLRRRVVVGPGQKAVISLVTVAGETREQVLTLLDKYRELQATNRAIDLAWTHAQLELRYLGLQADEGQMFQDLASHMLYPNAQLRPSAERLRRNALGQSRLWSYGISGDLPILAVVVSDVHDLPLVREALLAHTYWRVRGLKTDLVILNSEPGGYEQPLQTQLNRLIQIYSLHTGIDKPGGVFLRSIEQIPEEEVTLLVASARAVLVAARGSLAQQLSRQAEPPELPPPIEISEGTSEEPSDPLPFLELPYFNGLGGFTPDGREYATYLKPGDQTPLPWVNIMANPEFGSLVTEAGEGFAWYGNSQTNRQTPWVNDVLAAATSEGLYVRDEESGLFWSPTPLPSPDRENAYRARHGQGYSVFEHNSHGIQHELTTFVPLNQQGGEPLRIQRLRMRNTSRRVRRLSVTSYAEWTLGVDREETQQHIVTSWDPASATLLARNLYHPEFNTKVAFAGLAPKAQSFTADRTEFLGRNGSSESPSALRRQGLSGSTGAGLDPCGALQVVLELRPGATEEVSYLLGQANDLEQVRSIVDRFKDSRAVEACLAATKNWWDQLLGVIQVATPDLSINFLLNRWLLYQTLSCRFWARSAFYQSGGAFGFRDQLQDAMALVYAAPALAREHILRAASRQFLEGDVQHWWHPQSGAGIRTRCSDDLLWLPHAVAHYCQITGDSAILSERVPFLEGRALQPNESEAYLIPTLSMQDDSLFEHCWRAIQKGVTSGPHGLPLIGSGDWNDGLNRVGPQGRGESVWLAWFLIDLLKQFLPLCELRNETRAADFCRSHVQVLKEAAESHGWDGEWYRRGYFDDGTPLGSAGSQEAVIDSLPQSWAIISGEANPERGRQGLLSVRRHLMREKDKLVLLFTPPFDSSKPHPGYIMGYPPGVRENGGQYTHAAIWVAMASARVGDGGGAVEVLRRLNPVEHARTPDEVARYKGEPYAVAADVYALPSQEGRCGWTWYTGSSGWMYRVWLEEVLGFRLRGGRLMLDPVIPPEWKEFSITYRRGGTLYTMTVENPDGAGQGVSWIEIDGMRHSTPYFDVQDDKGMHTVRVRLGGSTRLPRTDTDEFSRSESLIDQK